MHNSLRNVILTLCALTAMQSHAQALNEQALKACTLVENDFKRLMCFDQVMANETPQIDNQAHRESVKAATPAKTEDQFGLEHISVIDENNTSLTAQITKVKKSPLGKVTVTLNNGQTWKQVDSDSFRAKSGDEVVISRGTLNSFLMKKVGTNRAIRVKRLQ
ncbi:hypothetical protein [Pseudoalteromonas rubra]|uniref:Uncharacterized protein n=1 Tax=Pseudoalteromonas rubra TaxID=43658 RepID=A0A5S3WWW3_9GAMM|nr:hypothetical protein [Pseudoalteromonas rubra]TMP34817.1 hypothetical protein CWB98_17640 [Pseudoalteromonas rubra]